MKITFMSQNKFMLMIGLLVCGVIDWYWSKSITNTYQTVFFVLAIIFQFYFLVEWHSNVTSNPIVIDFRSQAEKIEAAKTDQILMLEAAKNNLLMKIANGEINSKKANEIMINMYDFTQTKPLELPSEKDYV